MNIKNNTRVIVALLAFTALAILAISYKRGYKIISKQPDLRQSDFSVILAYINRPKGYAINSADSCFYLIDSDFRTFKNTLKRSASETRAQIIQKVLSQKLDSSSLNYVNISCLILPNTSKDLMDMKLRAERKWANKEHIFLLSFSAPCTTKDGKTYYYVEQVFKEDKRGTADVFIFNKGLLQSVISIWIN